MIDYCDRCSETFDPDQGDGETCQVCFRTLCEVCFGNRADDPNEVVCRRCRILKSNKEKIT